MRPCRITATVGHSSRATFRSWVTKMSVCLPTVSRSRSSTWSWMVASRAETGSSASKMLGRGAAARAIEMRWRCPPENCRGVRSPVPSSPTRASTSSARAVSTPASRIDVLTAIRGSSDEYGSWKTICTSPATLTVPALGSRRPAMRCKSDVLPEPDPPTMARRSPARTVRVTSSTARVCPRRSETPSSATTGSPSATGSAGGPGTAAAASALA